MGLSGARMPVLAGSLSIACAGDGPASPGTGQAPSNSEETSHRSVAVPGDTSRAFGSPLAIGDASFARRRGMTRGRARSWFPRDSRDGGSEMRASDSRLRYTETCLLLAIGALISTGRARRSRCLDERRALRRIHQRPGHRSRDAVHALCRVPWRWCREVKRRRRHLDRHTGPDKFERHGLGYQSVTPSTLYAGTLGEGVFKSTDSGDTWARANAGWWNLSVAAVAIDPVTPSRSTPGRGAAGCSSPPTRAAPGLLPTRAWRT